MPETDSAVTKNSRAARDTAERALLGAIASGDRAALTRLYTDYHPRLFRFVYRLGKQTGCSGFPCSLGIATFETRDEHDDGGSDRFLDLVSKPMHRSDPIEIAGEGISDSDLQVQQD